VQVQFVNVFIDAAGSNLLLHHQFCTHNNLQWLLYDEGPMQ